MNWEAKLAEYLEAFETAVQQVAPQAAETALAIVRINAISWLVGGVFLVAIAPFIIRFASTRFKRAHKESEKSISQGRNVDVEVGNQTAGWILYAAGFIGGGFGVAILLKVWNWVALFRPELRLAKDILDRALGQ